MQRGASDRDQARSSIRMLEGLVRLAQAHARLLFRAECTRMDAVFAIVLMEGSRNSSRLLEPEFSVLKAEFPADAVAFASKACGAVFRRSLPVRPNDSTCKT